ncbi:MAG TPA: FAD-dependent oxidoreductase, partial [Myxococcaceae bacterium]|nr:FAD-dependent oxidoreductase [Myxococcaceae bacterium]
LEDGEALRARGVNFESAWCDVQVGTRTLRRGEDFELVVLGIPVGALPPLTEELAARSPGWRDMLTHSRTVMTRAMQLWLTPSLAGLGWSAGPTILTTYQYPWSSWADMSDLVPREAWPPEASPRTIAYFCDVFPTPPLDDLPLGNPDYPTQLKQRVKESALTWLDRHIGHLWPEATTAANPDGLDYELLLAPPAVRGKQRFDWQYWRINASPWEQYVQTPPLSVRFRLAPEESGFSNLYLAGDWTRTSINGGSFEATVESGMRASRAICGYPRKVAGRFEE